MTSVDALVQGALKMSSGWSVAREVRVEVAFDGTGASQGSVRGTQPELTRALRNLVDNALSLSPVGGTVIVRVESTADAVRIVVDDAGPGVPRESALHVFTPFYRGAHRRLTAGAGLGLSIARRIARSAG